ncbi:MAG: GFA family protein [Hyphomicrobiaceae bacterium]
MIEGSCLCGGIRFEISGPVVGIVQCHCSLCRKSSGTGSIATVRVPADQLGWISGEDLVKTFARASGYGTAFCSVCGSPAPDADAERTQYGIPAGLLDGDPPLSVIEHIFVGSKAQWEAISGDAPRRDTM